MDKKDLVFQKLLQQKLLPLYYHESAEVSIQILSALHEAGIRLIEYTNRGESALANFRHLKTYAKQNMPDMLLGIGTIKNASQAKSYIEAEADYIVCPSTNVEVAQVTQDAGLVWIPGCMTPTEIATAENAGAKLVKIFPGNILGPGFITAIKELFPGMKFMPTGGVEIEEKNLRSWFDAGVCAVGMGSKLISKQAIENKEFGNITALTLQALEIIRSR